VSFYFPEGGLPDQSQRLYAPARFTTAYAVIPAAVLTDIVTSYLPGWEGMRAWIIARPLSGFAETFSQMIVELEPGGGSDMPESDPAAEGVLFVVRGAVRLSFGGREYALGEGGYAYLAAGEAWRVWNLSGRRATFHWIRKAWEPAAGIARPESFVASDADTPVRWMPGTGERWGTTRFVEPTDLRHDMHVNIVTFRPGGVIPFAETHVMEHGLYVLEGRGDYLLNTDRVEVGPGDFMWLRAFCPQACEVVGDATFRYLLYKDVNRMPRLRPAPPT
jgi:(S)-ureidoglycine aminohydrolase